MSSPQDAHSLAAVADTLQAARRRCAVSASCSSSSQRAAARSMSSAITVQAPGQFPTNEPAAHACRRRLRIAGTWNKVRGRHHQRSLPLFPLAGRTVERELPGTPAAASEARCLASPSCCMRPGSNTQPLRLSAVLSSASSNPFRNCWSTWRRFAAAARSWLLAWLASATRAWLEVISLVSSPTALLSWAAWQRSSPSARPLACPHHTPISKPHRASKTA